MPTASIKYVNLDDEVRAGCPKLGHTSVYLVSSPRTDLYRDPGPGLDLLLREGEVQPLHTVLKDIVHLTIIQGFILV